MLDKNDIYYEDKVKQMLENQTWKSIIISSSGFWNSWWEHLKEYQQYQEEKDKYIIWNHYNDWLNYNNQWLKNNNIKTEEKEMAQNVEQVVEIPVYPELGEVWVTESLLENPVGGEVILMCPGLTVDNFTVRDNDCHYTIMVTYNDEVVFEDVFQLNPEYAVVKSGWDVQNGVFKLLVKYDLGSDVKNDKSVFKEQ